MKVCARCNQQLNNEATVCNRCGNTVFKPIKPRPQVQQYNQTQNVPNRQSQGQMQAIQHQGQAQGQMNRANPNRQQNNIKQNSNNIQQHNKPQNQFVDSVNQQKQQVKNIKQTQNNNQFTDDVNTKITNTDMSVKDWIIQIILTAIPILNIIMFIKGMNNKNYPEYRRNFCKAFLIYYIAAFILSFILTIVMSSIGIL